MLGIDTLARVAKELRRDVVAARDRDPAARGVGPVEILATWPGIHALLAYRVAHALDGAGVPRRPRRLGGGPTRGGLTAGGRRRRGGRAAASPNPLHGGPRFHRHRDPPGGA